MLTVIMIISILFVITVPSLGRTARNFHFSNKSKQVQALMVFLKKAAALENRKHKLLLDLQNDSYEVLSENRDDDYEQFQPSKDSFLKKQSLAEGLDLRGASEFEQNLEIIFSPLGSISSSKFYIVDSFEHRAGFTTTLSGQIILEFDQND